jgi:hypothetical protein
MGGTIERTMYRAGEFKIGMMNWATTSAAWFSLGGWRLRPLESVYGWSLYRACKRDRAVTRQASNRSAIKSHLGTSEAMARSAKAGNRRKQVFRGAQR